MRLKQFMFGLLLSSLFVFMSVSGNEQINITEWPSQSYESQLLTLQFVDLEFRLPHDRVGRVIVMGGGSNLAFSRNEEGSDHVIVFRTVDEFQETYELFRKKGFFKGLEIHDVESFFDALAKAPDEADFEALKTMRHVMRFEDADCSKTTQGVFTTYRLKATQPGGQIVYILIDGQEAVYEIAGTISEADFKMLISGMALSTVH